MNYTKIPSKKMRFIMVHHKMTWVSREDSEDSAVTVSFFLVAIGMPAATQERKGPPN